MFFLFYTMQISRRHLLLITFFAVFPQLLFSQQTGWEFNLLRSLAEKRTPSGNRFHERFTKLNGTICLAVPAGIFVTALIEKDKSLRNDALFITESIVISSMMTWSLKKIVDRDRPAIRDPAFVAVINKEGPGFPSGHTSLAFSMATSLSMKYPKWYVIVPAFTYAGFTGYSRLYLGVHYPTDVLAGALVGSGSAWLTWKLNQWLHPSKKKRGVPAF